MSLYLYHYTNLNGATGINNDRMIYASPADSKYAFHGQGVYMTAMSPSFGRRAILWNNYGKSDTDTYLGQKSLFYYKFDAENLPLVHKIIVNGRDVYVCREDIDLNTVPYESGNTDNTYWANPQ